MEKNEKIHMTRKKIILFIHGLFIGGSERNVIDIARFLNREKFDAELCVLSTVNMYSKELVLQVPSLKVIPWIVYLPVNLPWAKTNLKLINPFRFAQWIAYLYKNRNCVWHFFCFPLIYLGGLFAMLFGNKKLITTIQDWDPWKNSIHVWLDNITYPYVAKIICDGYGCNTHWAKRLNLDAQKLLTIYDGIDTETLKATKPAGQLRREAGLPADALVAGLIARFDIKKKGHDVFLDAAFQILKKYPDAKFLICGYGKDELKIKNMIAEKGLGKDVVFMGARNDLANILSVLDVVVIASYSESVPKLLLEAMFLGKAIVSTDAGDIREVLEDGHTGLVVPKGEPGEMAAAVERFFGSEKFRRDCGENARQKVMDCYTIDKSIAKLETNYTAI